MTDARPRNWAVPLGDAGNPLSHTWHYFTAEGYALVPKPKSLCGQTYGRLSDLKPMSDIGADEEACYYCRLVDDRE